MRQSVEEAIVNLCLEKHGDTEIYWTGIAENYDSLDKVKRIDGKELKFTWEEVQEKQKVLDKEFADSQYQRPRATEYPPIGDQLDALYHAGVFPTDMAAKIKKVKDDNPKS